MDLTMGERIRVDRKRLEWTQTQLAERLADGGNATSISQISRWEKDEARPTLGQLATMRNCFGWPDELVLQWLAQ